MNTEWRSIPGFSLYEASPGGQIRNRKTGRILKPATGWYGYDLLSLRADAGGFKTVRVHRMVALAFIPNPDALPEINHIDGDPANNAVSNIEWVTRQQNIAHAAAMDRFPSISYHERRVHGGGNILTEEAVVAIRRSTEPVRHIAKRLGVSHQTVWCARTGRTWKHVEEAQ